MLYKGDCQSNSFAMHAGTGLHLHQHLHNKGQQLPIVRQEADLRNLEAKQAC